jgi:catalase
MQYQFSDATARVYTPNSYGGPEAEPARAGEGSWETDGALIRAAQTLHAEDDDFGQAGTLYREVFDDEAKARLLETLLGQYGALTVDRIKTRFIEYWTNVDAGLGAQISARVAAAGGEPDGAPLVAPIGSSEA